MARILINFVLFLVFTSSVLAQSAHNHRQTADKKYWQGVYNEAEEGYRKALEKDPEVKGHFNLGNSLFQQQRFEEAREQYDKAIARSDDPLVQSKAYFNRGNSFFNEKNLQKSIESFKEAIRKNPRDEDAKKNLLLSKQLLRQQQEQEKQQQDQQQEQNEEDKQEDNKDQEQQEEQEQKQEEQQEQKEQSLQDSTMIDSLMQKNITREELMKLLKAIEDEDKKIQQKLRRGTGQKKKSEKDW